MKTLIFSKISTPRIPLLLYAGVLEEILLSRGTVLLGSSRYTPE